MAIKLTTVTKKLHNDFVEVETEKGIEKVEFSYVGYSPALSKEVDAAVADAIEAGESTNVTVETLVRILTHIGLLDEDDNPIAITRENLMAIPFDLLNAIITKVMEAANPKKKN